MHNLAVKTVQAGQAGARAEDIYTWSVRGLNAQLDLSSKKADHISAFDDHLHRMQDLGKVVQTRLKVGIGSSMDAAAADFYIAEAELWFAREKAAAK